MGKCKRFTEDDISKMTELYNSGFTIKQIAKYMGRGDSSVRYRLQSLGIVNKTKEIDKSYFYKIGEIVNDTLQIIEQTRDEKYNRKSYIVKSLIYPNAPYYKIAENNLKKGVGCAYVSGRRIYEGNSLYNIKWVRHYLVDVEEAKTIAPGSDKIKINLKCPECGTQKQMRPDKLTSYGFNCLICNKGTSYPELLFNSFNEIANLGYVTQQELEGLPGRYFDFVNYESRTIVETHGLQHYKKTKGHFSDAYDKTIESDKEKREYCKNNNWTLIELDCRRSDFSFIVSSINNCEHLPNIDKDKELKIMSLIENNKRYPVKEIIKLYTSGLSTLQISKKLNMCNGTVWNILQRHNTPMRKNGTWQKTSL